MKRREALNLVQSAQRHDSAWERWTAGSRGAAWLDGDVEAAVDLQRETIQGVVHLYLFAPIGGFFGIVAEDMVAELRAAGDRPMVIHIDSPGGLVHTGWAIRNLLRRRKAETTALIEGMCASAATVIASGCDRRIMARGSEWMIHTAWMLAIVNAEEATAVADRLAKIDRDYAEEYARIGVNDADYYAEAQRRETWYSRDEAVEQGFAEAEDEDASASALDRTSGGMAKSTTSGGENHQLAFDNAENGAQDGRMATENSEVAMTDAEKQELEQAKAELAAAKAKLAESEQATALADAAAKQAEAEAAAEAANARAEKAEAALADAQLEAKVADYPEGVRAMAKLVLASGDEAAIKQLNEGLAKTAADAKASTAVNGDTNADADEAADAQERYTNRVAKLANEKGLSLKNARAEFEKTAEGQNMLTDIANARRQAIQRKAA